MAVAGPAARAADREGATAAQGVGAAAPVVVAVWAAEAARALAAWAVAARALAAAEAAVASAVVAAARAAAVRAAAAGRGTVSSRFRRLRPSGRSSTSGKHSCGNGRSWW